MAAPSALRVCHLSGLRDLASDYRAFLVDLWGVVHDGARPFDGAVDALERLRDLGRPVVFVSNTSRRAEDVARHLATMGIGPDLYRCVVSAGEAAFLALSGPARPAPTRLSARCLPIGFQPGGDWVAALPFQRVTSVDEADFLLGFGLLPAGTGQVDHEPVLLRALQRSLPLVCANPDEQVLIDGRAHLAAGSLARWYEEMGGEVRRFGKPAPEFYEQCLARVAPVPRRRVVAIGDSLTTDVVGAARLGIATVLVSRTGLHAQEFAATDPTRALDGLIARHGVCPDILLPAFVW